MSQKLLILGGGTAGTMMAHHLRRKLPKREWDITVIDRDDRHYYQPGFLFYPFGHYDEEDIVKSKRAFMPKGVDFRIAEIERIDPPASQVVLKDETAVHYDLLIVATGSRIAPEETAGMLDGEWRKSIHDFYTFEGATALREKLADWDGGKLVVQVTEMPIKCPVAPLEFAFLADSFFKQRRMRDKVEITYVTPLSGAFTKPTASKKLGHLLSDKGIKLEAEFVVERIDPAARKLVCFDGREVDYDLLVTTPVNMGERSRPARITSWVWTFVWVIQHGICLGCIWAEPRKENTGTGSRSPGCSSRTDQSMLRPSRRGGVPVLSRPWGRLNARRRSDRAMAGGSPARPAE